MHYSIVVFSDQNFMILAFRVLRDPVDARRIRFPGDQRCIVNYGRHSGEP